MPTSLISSSDKNNPNSISEANLKKLQFDSLYSGWVGARDSVSFLLMNPLKRDAKVLKLKVMRQILKEASLVIQKLPFMRCLLMSKVLNKVLGRRLDPTQKAETWNMESTDKIQVTFNMDGKPVGEEGNELVQYLGTLVRMAEHVSIEYPDWRKVPMQKKEDMYTLVKGKFMIHPAETPAIKKWIIYSMGKKWRTWKGTLKARGFDQSLDIDQIVARETQKDNRVNPEQFKELVTRWFTSEHQSTCEVRRASRSKMHEPHVTGTKSFARLAHEEAVKNNGKYPTRGEIYIKSHTRKNGTIVDDKAAEVVASLQAAPRDSTNVQGSEANYSNDDYSKVKGPEKRGYIRCVGRMPVVKEKGASASASSSTDPRTVQQLQDELARQKNVVNVMLSLFQEHIPNANLSGVLSNLNIQIPGMSSSIPSVSPSVNERSSP